ncbi:MAG: hypothetical protein FJ146_07065 [Deltaproteobacteria bacterium]|nr:hypothetical protein [Deltaproteobacteria bacterium]
MIQRLRLHGWIAVFSSCAITSCLAKQANIGARQSRLSTFMIGEFKPQSGDPAWDRLEVSLKKSGATAPTAIQTFMLQDFTSGTATNVSLTIPQGTYAIAMDYAAADGKQLYSVCTKDKDKLYEIYTPQFTTSLPICRIDAPQPSGTVDVTPSSNVTITPVVGDSRPLPSAQSQQLPPVAQQSSPGCSATSPETGMKTVNVNVNGANRTMIRVVSPTYKSSHAYALVIGFHGLGLDGNSPRNHHKWPIIEDLGKNDAIFIYPNAAGGSWSPYPGSPDFAFFDAIVKTVGDEYCLNKNRVFVHGFSNGSYFVNALASARSSAIRGVISVSGGGTGSKKPAMVIHGQSDGTVGFYQAPGLVSSYASANGCKTPVNTSEINNESCRLLTGCPADLPVWFCPWGGGHHWPEYSLPFVWRFISSLQ